jgi:hypothetical protein
MATKNNSVHIPDESDHHDRHSLTPEQLEFARVIGHCLAQAWIRSQKEPDRTNEPAAAKD